MARQLLPALNITVPKWRLVSFSNVYFCSKQCKKIIFLKIKSSYRWNLIVGRLSTCSSTATLKSSLDLSDNVQRKKNSVVLVCPRTFPRIFFICIKTYEYFLIMECYLLSFFFSLPDCIVTGWSPWTSCSKKCNRGKKFRVRKIIKSEKKDGVSCPTKLKDRTRCRMQPCPTSWWVLVSVSL